MGKNDDCISPVIEANPAEPMTSAIYENAIDSVRVGMEFFLRERSYSSR
jgi:hypothetical protein